MYLVTLLRQTSISWRPPQHLPVQLPVQTNILLTNLWYAKHVLIPVFFAHHWQLVRLVLLDLSIILTLSLAIQSVQRLQFSLLRASNAQNAVHRAFNAQAPRLPAHLVYKATFLIPILMSAIQLVTRLIFLLTENAQDVLIHVWHVHCFNHTLATVAFLDFFLWAQLVILRFALMEAIAQELIYVLLVLLVV